jgi:hypothetical protein
MIWVILGIAALVVVAAGAALVGGLLRPSHRHLDDYRQVVPGLGPAAPREWAGAHSPEAKLHRRIRDAVKSAHAQPGAAASALAQLDQAAVALDQRLIGAAAVPERHRAAAVAEIAPLVDRFEDGVAVIATGTASAALDTAFDQSMAAIQTELDALALARAEVERIDGQAPPG